MSYTEVTASFVRVYLSSDAGDYVEIGGVTNVAANLDCLSLINSDGNVVGEFRYYTGWVLVK